MFNVYVFLVVSLCVFGFTESAVVKKETKRHIVDDPLINMFRQQELLLRNIESTMVEKLNKLDAKINSVDLKYEAKANNFSQSLGEITNMLRKICPAGYVGNMWGCYEIYNTQANFDTARRQCQNVGAHLVQLHSAEQLSGLMKLMADNGATISWYWAGGRKLQSGWTWVDGNVPFTYYNWYPDNPSGNGDCVDMLYNPSDQHHSKWDDVPCTFTRPFICEI